MAEPGQGRMRRRGRSEVSPFARSRSLVQVYDVASDSWSEAGDHPSRIETHSGIHWKGELYVFGGKDETGTEELGNR